MRDQKLARAAALPIAVAIAFAGFATGCQPKDEGPAVVIFHAPAKFDRRADDFTLNITGELAARVEAAKFRVNDGEWSVLPQGQKRIKPPEFAIEIDHADLRDGKNRVEIAVEPAEAATLVEFAYDPNPIALPIQVDWKTWPLAADDGYWETYESGDGSWRVRTVPGYEGFDRILIVAGAFDGGRRVETDMVYRYTTAVDYQEWGFGLLPLWGGRPDAERAEPLRRGWLFGIAWYFNRYRGIGLEFSERDGTLPPGFTALFRDWILEADKKYRIVSEAVREVDSKGVHRAYRQRMKWWKDGEAEPDRWIELVDAQGAPLPERPYGVGLITFRTQVDFGAVSITALPDRVVAD